MINEIFSQACLNYTTDNELILSLFQEISYQYNSPKRFYHNFMHINEMLDELTEFRNEIGNYEDLLFSIIYHDVIYNAKLSDNEEKSAEFARKQLEIIKYPNKNINKVENLIISTKKHQAFDSTFDSKLLLDLDLMILGSSDTNYFAYAEKIRNEYNFVPLFLYRKKRKEVMQRFLETERIYLTDYFYSNFEKQARNNIKQEILRLS